MLTSNTPVPVAEGLFQVQDATVQLRGTRCRSCGSHYFPIALNCRNPQCSDKQVENVLLSRQGTLYSYTRQLYQPPALFRMEPWAPYTLGLVELSEGIRVLGMLSDCPPEQVHIGMALELTTRALYRNEVGQDVLTYQFRPLDPQENAA